MTMREILTGLIALVRKSGGGGDNLESLEPQGVAAVALFLRDGRVAVLNADALEGGGGSVQKTPSVSLAADSSLREGALEGVASDD